MLAFTALLPLLPLLGLTVHGMALPNKRDDVYDSVKDAVEAFGEGAFPVANVLAGTQSIDDITDCDEEDDDDAFPDESPDPSPTSAGPSPSSVVVNAQVLGAGVNSAEPGHWQVFTTSAWIPNVSAPSSSVSDSAAAAAGPSSWYGEDVQVQNLGLNAAASGAPPAPPSPPAPPAPGPSAGAVPSSSPAPSPSVSLSPAPQPSGGGNYLPGKHVFAHFMVGIVSTYQQSDWVKDIQLAKEKGISGFALNIGADPYTEDQLDLAYEAAQNVGGFEMFISVDFNWFKIGDTSKVAALLKRYVGLPAQLLVEGKPFVSSFIGDGFDWSACSNLVGRELYAVPFYQPSVQNANDPGVSGLFSWAAWPGQLDNQPLKANMTMNRDDDYLNVLNPAGKQYMAPISPWFFTHFGPEVPYAKNWLFYSEVLWSTRWDQILDLGQKGVNFVEIVTWNDYGEAHHIGPYDTPHTDDGASKWAEGLDHSAMLEFSIPYIQAFRRGEREPVITKDQLFYWHRPHLKDAQCDSTDNCGSKPNGWEMVDDSIFVSTMTKNGGTVTVTSGNNAPVIITVAPGAQTFEVPMGVGEQQFKLTSNGGGSASGSSSVPVTSGCWNGIYNFNFHSGVVE